MDEKSYEKYMKGTTIVGIVCTDGVALGCDSRATFDTYIASASAQKLFKIDKNLGVMIAGGVGDCQAVVRILKVNNELYKMNEGRSMSPKSAASLLSIILQDNKMVPFIAFLIIGGVDNDKPQLYSMDYLGGYTEEPKFTSTGSGSMTALGYLEDAYKKAIPAKDAVKDVVKAVSVAMKHDAATGDTIYVATITKDGYKEYTTKELEKIAAQ